MGGRWSFATKKSLDWLSFSDKDRHDQRLRNQILLSILGLRAIEKNFPNNQIQETFTLPGSEWAPPLKSKSKSKRESFPPQRHRERRRSLTNKFSCRFPNSSSVLFNRNCQTTKCFLGKLFLHQYYKNRSGKVFLCSWFPPPSHPHSPFVLHLLFVLA